MSERGPNRRKSQKFKKTKYTKSPRNDDDNKNIALCSDWSFYFSCYRKWANQMNMIEPATPQSAVPRQPQRTAS